MKNYPSVLLVASEFPPLPGGIGNHAFNLAKNLLKNGYPVSVTCDYRSSDHKLEDDFDLKNKFKTIRFTRNRPIWITYITRLIRICKESRKHHIIIASGKFSIWIVGLFIQNRAKVVVVHGSEVNMNNKILRNVTNYSLKKFDKIISVSNNTKDLMKGQGISNITVIPNGFDLEKFAKLKISSNETISIEGEPILITVGNVNERKGQDNVIGFLPEVLKKFPNVHYHILGIPTMQKEFENLSMNLGVADHVTFHGKVSDRDLVKSLKRSDCFVMLSRTTTKGQLEGFGIAILEANFFGVPAIGSLNCGIEDAIKEGVTGYLINPSDSKDFNAALIEIMRNKKVFEKESINWAKDHSWDRIIKQYIEVILTVKNL